MITEKLQASVSNWKIKIKIKCIERMSKSTPALQNSPGWCGWCPPLAEGFAQHGWEAQQGGRAPLSHSLGGCSLLYRSTLLILHSHILQRGNVTALRLSSMIGTGEGNLMNYCGKALRWVFSYPKSQVLDPKWILLKQFPIRESLGLFILSSSFSN